MAAGRRSSGCSSRLCASLQSDQINREQTGRCRADWRRRQSTRPTGANMKIVKWTALVLVVIVIVVGVIVYMNLNRIVKRTIETQGTASLNVQTTLDSAS